MAPAADPFAAALKEAFIIAGPTAVGKTALALAIARELGAEIVGADAFQVYEGLDLLTAKPTERERAEVPHHLVGIVPLGEAFHVQRYVELARAAILDIHARGRRALIVGGTGMYLRALVRGLDETPPGDPALRAHLTGTPLPELVERLRVTDPQTTVDLQNARRVVRALEVCLLSGRPFSSFRTGWEHVPPVSGALLTRPREELYARINERAAALFEHGVVEEVAAAAAAGPSAQQVIGWREIQALRRGELTQAQCVEQIAQATRRYAKRQLTWFRREPMLQALSLSANTDNLVLLRRMAASAAAPSPTSPASGAAPGSASPPPCS